MKYRGESPEKFEEWKKACSEFHQQYDILSFPGGFNGAYERIVAGDEEAIEAGICFIECRPYFFRSGYMFQRLLRKLKRAPLTKNQLDRVNEVRAAYDAHRKSKRKNDFLI